MTMKAWVKLVLFIYQLKDRAVEHVDNTLFGESLAEHGLFIFLPIIEYFYLISEDIENISLNLGIFLAILLLLCIYVLNSNYCLVNREASEHIICRSTDPDRVNSILVECADRSGNHTPSTKMYAFLWETSYWDARVGHLCIQLFDELKMFLSRWPGECIKFTNPASIKQPVAAVFSDTLAEDIHSEEGYLPDYVIVIPEGMLRQENVDAMITWYDTVAKGPTGIYKGKFKNCADLVRHALKVGKFYLANPSLRWLKLGLSVPNDIADRIVLTICLKRSSLLIRLSHHILTITIWMLSMFFVAVIFGLLRTRIPERFVTFLFQGVWLLPYHLLRALS